MKIVILYSLLILGVFVSAGASQHAPAEPALIKEKELKESLLLIMKLNREIAPLEKRISHFDKQVVPIGQKLNELRDFSFDKKIYQYWLELLYSALEAHNKKTNFRIENLSAIKLITNEENESYINWLELLDLQAEEQMTKPAATTFANLKCGKYKHNPIELKTNLELISPQPPENKLLKKVMAELI